MDPVSAELPAKTLVVAIDPGKATSRVLLADGERGQIGEPVSLPTLCEGIERLCELIDSQAAPETVIAIEATGSPHLPWLAELERRLPGATRLFTPSQVAELLAQAPGERRDALMGIAWGLSHRGPGCLGSARLPARSSNASNPTALRRGALRSNSACARAVTALQLCPARAQTSLPHDGA